jgi:subtilisin-like proprotein convertase family protein
MSLSRRIGTWPCAQLVVDALKLTSANPSLLAARDAMLLAADQLATARGDSDADRRAFVHSVWTTFAEYGMGPDARTEGPALRGIVADFNAPPFLDAMTVRATATPELRIPDNNASGIRSTIELGDAGTVAAVAVTVDITHPYVGDLVVALIAPWGDAVTLRDRVGASADDIHETFRPTGFSGRPVGGAWTLAVFDTARLDVGELVSWTIEVDVGEPTPRFEQEVDVGALIPDADAGGVTSSVDVDLAGAVGAMTLFVDITHTFVGDLQVALTGPTGKRVVVHRRRGGGDDNLIATYPSGDGGVLEPFVGLPAAGTWTLSVSDRARRDVGKLNRWRLVVESGVA